MIFFVQTISGNKLKYDIKPEETIKDLKERLYERTGLVLIDQIIVYKGINS
jgi:hypothetical protein